MLAKQLTCCNVGQETYYTVSETILMKIVNANLNTRVVFYSETDEIMTGLESENQEGTSLANNFEQFLQLSRKMMNIMN